MIPIRKALSVILAILAVSAFGIIFVRAFYYYPSDEVVFPEDTPEDLIQEAIQSGDASVVKATLAAAKKSTTVKNVIKKPEPKPVITMQLSIPKIGVDAKVQEVGISSKGNMASPRSFYNVGWYKYGPKPGETGSAVMAGHVDNGVALPAVFHKLDNLEAGDDVYVETKEGKKLHFTVVSKKTYSFDSNPPEVFNENDGKFLKLITCTGAWIKELRTHDKRLVVKAVLVE